MPSRGGPIAWMTLLAVAGCAHEGGAAQPAGAAPVTLAPEATGARKPAALPDRPATHLGRVVLPRADVIVRGKVTTATPAAHGAIVGRVAPSEWLRGEPREDEETLIVMSPAVDALPGAGRDALFLLASRPVSDNLGLVDVAALDDADGPARLAAMKKYLEIEAIPEPASRVAALRAYLRAALVSDDRWTRSNAAREFSALAAEMPGSLAAEDRPALESALERTREKELRRLIQSALDECPGAAARLPRPAGPVADGTDALSGPTARYSAKDATLAVRRQAIIDAAVQTGAGSAPLLARALDDEAPPVREAAVAAAGEYRIESLEPKIAAMLADDSSPVVRRTVVVAVGYLKSTASVPILTILAKEGGPFSREAAFALARIRDDAALAALRRLESDARDRDRRELLRFLASDAFVEQERALSQKR